MATARITIELDTDVARAYRTAPEEKQKKMQALLNLWLREFAAAPATPLRVLMDEISDKAEDRGLTPEILESLLNAE